VDGLLQTMNADPRVQFPQAKAPTSESFARAVISLADAIVRGDSAKLRPLLTPPDRAVLEQLEGSEQWTAETSKLEAARVVYAGEGVLGAPLAVLALQAPDGAYLLGWNATNIGDTWVFSSVPTSATVRSRASEWDNVPLMGLIAVPTGVELTDVDAAAAQEVLDEVKKKLQEMAPEDDNNKDIEKRTPAGPVKIPQPGSG
jgi:hypothetical protein